MLIRTKMGKDKFVKLLNLNNNRHVIDCKAKNKNVSGEPMRELEQAIIM